MARMKDIAREVNVSVPLVSKVLNGKLGSTGASEKTIQMIEAAARRMGYVPNRAATSLTLGRQDTLAVLLHRHGVSSSGLSSATLDGIAEAAGRHHQRLELALVAKQDFLERLRQLSRAAVDAVIVAGVYHPDAMDLLEAMHKKGLPVVTIYGELHSDMIPNVGCSAQAIGSLAFEHLREAGTRRIICLDCVKERSDGFMAACREAGGADESQSLLPMRLNHLDQDSGEQAAAALLEKKVKFDGVFAQSDVQALGLMRGLMKAGLRIPGDVKVLGVDNSPLCQAGLITLSSIDVNMQVRASEAVELALAMRNGEKVSSQEMTPKVIVRESTAE